MGRADSRRSDAADAVVFAPDAPVSVVSVKDAYAAHYSAVFRYALALTRSIDDAEDITAEVFTRALRSWSAVPPHPLPWLLLVARRIATDRVRRAKRFVTTLGALRPAQAPDAGEARTEFWAWFEAVGAVLTDRQREALVLRYERDLTDADIGEILALSESGVRSLVARALASLREHPELL
jgi:RNA polymerase sigma factor (sigma-70 family)